MLDKVTALIDQFDATFVRCSGGSQIWELPNIQTAKAAMLAVDGSEFNWCPIQQPHGPKDRLPQIKV